MIAQTLCEKFPFAANYFKTLLIEKPGKFPQSMVFEGMDIFGEIFFSLELARILNCKESKGQDCKCINCNWIREGKHPAVTFVSQLDFKGQGDETKTVISTKQAQGISKALEQTSDFHRVFIFLDVKAQALDETDKSMLGQYAKLDYSLPKESWKPSGLTYRSFHANAPNALLKSVEEPPANTTFIFLSKNKEEIMQTIVSRSQTFKLPGGKINLFRNDVSSFLKDYPNISVNKALEVSEKLQEYLKENETPASSLLDMLENHLGELLKVNLENIELVKIINKDIRLLAKAKRQLGAAMSAKIVFDSLLIEMSAR